MYRKVWFSYSNLPGPPSDSMMVGCFVTLSEAAPASITKEWYDKYGWTIRYRSLWGANAILTRDPVVAQFICTHTADFPTSDVSDLVTRDFCGPHNLTAQVGDNHKRHRKILGTAFSPAVLKRQYPVLLAVAARMRDKLLRDKTREIEALDYMGRISIDMIGEAGFGHDFRCIESEGKATAEMARAWSEVEKSGTIEGFGDILDFSGAIPKGYGLSNRERRLRGARAAMFKAAREILEERRRQLSSAHSKDDIDRSDMLSILRKHTPNPAEIVRANVAEDLPPSQRLSDEETLGQIPLMIFGANATIRSANAYSLLVLAEHPNVQDKLRKEMMKLDEEPD